MKRVIFYNHFNNGDIHVSREFVRGIMSKITTPSKQFFYSHKNDPKLIVDIPDLAADRSFLGSVGTVPKTSMVGDSLFINTWYASDGHRYMNRYGISFDCLYFLFDDICKERFGFSLSDISSDPKIFFPSINYAEYHIKPASDWISAHPGKKVFISNGPALSGQADNFSMTNIIKTLASKYPNVIFIVTNKDDNLSETSNIVYSSSIIQKAGQDLNENGYLSTFCDLIIGRASGPFSFAFTRENIFNRRATILCFSNLESKGNNKFWLGDYFRDRIEYTAKIVVSGETREDRVLAIIEGNL